MGNDKTKIMGSQADSAAVQDLEQQCPNCSAEMLEGEQFCPKCGYQRGTWQADVGEAESSDEREAVFELHSAEGMSWPIFTGENEIGRGEVSIQVDNPYASRLHARIVVAEDGTATLEDLGSSNGTIIADEPIPANEPREIGTGAEFSIGSEIFTLQDAPEVAARDEEEVEPEVAEESPGEAERAESPKGAEEAESAAGAEAEEDAGETDASESEEEVMQSPWSLAVEGGETRRLPLGETILGRKSGVSGIVITGDGYVSGTHCKVTASFDSLVIEDLGSTNGTKIDGELITPGDAIELTTASAVVIGQTNITVGHDADAAQMDAEDEAESPDGDDEGGADA